MGVGISVISIGVRVVVTVVISVMGHLVSLVAG